jgi:signal transduction histidine kinase
VIGRACDEVFQPVEAGVRFSELLPPPGGKAKITIFLRSGRPATLAITGARLAPPEAGKARIALVLRDVSDEEAVHRLLGDFLANIAHEFRTPLSALAASIELLLDQLPDLSQAELQELLNSLHLGTLSLQTLIDNLLEGASIETGRFRVYPRPADLAEIIQEAAGGLRPLLEKYNQLLRLELPDELPAVQADPRRTGQVLVNLLSNAIKHNPSGGEIAIIVTCSPDLTGDPIRVQVMDQGPGILSSQLPGLFQRFAYQGKREEGGAGLGLSVVKAIVEAQGGAVGAENRPEDGAVFWFSLQVAGEKMEAV